MGRPKTTYDSDGEGGDERQRLVKRCVQTNLGGTRLPAVYLDSCLFVCSKLASYTAPKDVMEDIPVEEDGDGRSELPSENEPQGQIFSQMFYSQSDSAI